MRVLNQQQLYAMAVEHRTPASGNTIEDVLRHEREEQGRSEFRPYYINPSGSSA